MPVTFHIPGPLRTYTNGESHVGIQMIGDGNAMTLRKALETLWERYPGIRYRLVTEQGGVREHINIFVGEESIRYSGGLDTPVTDGCEISIIPAVSGG
jgi:molybdopterin converting factor small subunit